MRLLLLHDAKWREKKVGLPPTPYIPCHFAAIVADYVHVDDVTCWLTLEVSSQVVSFDVLTDCKMHVVDRDHHVYEIKYPLDSYS